MKVSILVPVYKVERYIEECIRSLFEQTYEDIEYVFVDDCSPDNSINILKQVAKEYPDRQPFIQIIRNEHNLGLCKTREVLLSHATGEYVITIDSDDYIDKSAIETFVNVAKQTNADIIRQNYYEVYDDHSKKIYNLPFKSKDELVSNTIKSGVPSIESLWKLFIKRSIFTDYDIVFPKINYCEDWVLSIELFYFANTVVDIDNAFYYYRIMNSGSICHNRPYEDEYIANDTIRHFLDRYNNFEKYKESFFLNTFRIKAKHLIDKSILDIDKYMTYYPEVNNRWRLYNYGKRERILFWLAEHHMKFILKSILHAQT